MSHIWVNLSTTAAERQNDKRNKLLYSAGIQLCQFTQMNTTHRIWFTSGLILLGISNQSQSIS